MLIFLIQTPLHSRTVVQTGLEVLASQNFSSLKGKKVAVVTNRTAITSIREGIIPLLRKNNIHLVKIFSPEHGFSATRDSKVSGGALDGIPLVSLYGNKKKMDIDDLSGVDVCLFDIQSVGARYYTYIATMVYTMQACAESSTKCIILDRPNPSGGMIVSGFMPDKGLSGKFTSIYPVPIRHGMTMGELAQMFNKEHRIGAKLTVIQMKGWKRNMLFSDTQLPWINPSPNIQSEEAAILYTGLGWLETTALSMGRGNPDAFEKLGAPYIDGKKLASSLQHVDGFIIKPTSFVPNATYHKFYGKRCNGISIQMKDKHKADAFYLSLEIYRVLVKHYPKDYTDYGGLPVSSGKRALRKLITAKDSETLIQENITQLSAFNRIRSTYLLY